MAAKLVAFLAELFPGGSTSVPLSRKKNAIFVAMKNVLKELEFAEYDVEEKEQLTEFNDADFIKVEGIDFPVHQRDNLLKLHSLTHHHFSNPEFTDFIPHAWKKAGFIDHDLPYLTPMQKCFPPFDGSCWAESGCSTPFFAVCSYSRCTRRFCFPHFVEHRC